MKTFIQKIEIIILIAILMMFELAVFIIQSSFSLEESLFFLPLKLAPLFITTFLIAFLLMRYFKTSKKKRLSLLLALIMTSASLTFSYLKVEPYFKEIKFENLKVPLTIQIHSTIEKRLIVSTLEFVRLFPLLKTDRDVLNQLSTVFRESLIILELKNNLQPSLIKRTCSDYLKSPVPFGSCVPDLHKAVLSQMKLSATGNILLTSVAALGVFTTKEYAIITNAKQQRMLLLKIYNDIIEIAFNSCLRAKETILTPARGLPEFIDQELEVKHLAIAYKKFLSVSDLAQKEAQSLSQTNELKRVQKLKSEMAQLGIKTLISEKFQAKRREQSGTLKGLSLFYLFGQELSGNFYSKIFTFISKEPEESLNQEV